MEIVKIEFNPTITVEQIKDAIHNHLTTIPEPIGMGCYKPRNKLYFTTLKGTEMSISIQASETHYSEPREMSGHYGFYSEIELGFPSWEFSSLMINKFAENKNDPTGTVYPYVPIFVVAHEIFRAFMYL